MGSPWGVGYPGWHIECSGISINATGEDLDLHCGGIDNAFPITPTKLPSERSLYRHNGADSGFTSTT